MSSAWERKKTGSGRFQSGLVVIGLVLLALDLIYHKHGHFEYEEWFGFFPLFGLAACLVLVLVAYVLRAVVQRGEDYYLPQQSITVEIDRDD